MAGRGLRPRVAAWRIEGSLRGVPYCVALYLAMRTSMGWHFLAGRARCLPWPAGSGWLDTERRLGWDPSAKLRDADCGVAGTPYRQQPLGQSPGSATEFVCGSLTFRPAMGSLATRHPRRDRRTVGPRPGAAWDRRRHQRLSIAGRYPPPTNSDSECPFHT